MDILLTHGYFLNEDAAEQRIMKPYPPLGMLFVTSHLKRAGFDVEVLDTTFAQRTEVERTLRERRPPIVGIYGTLMTRRAVLWLIDAARAVGARVVLGGPEPPNYADEYLASGADVIVAGEGEVTLEELIPVLHRAPPVSPERHTMRADRVPAGDLAAIAGITFKDETGRVRPTAPRPQIKDLDAQPFPDREAIELEQYFEAWRRHGRRSVSVITARGCPFTCKWCSHSVYGFTHRRRSPENVADELELLRDRYGADHVWYADDVFTINKRWIARYAEELDKRGIKLPFDTITREDRLDEKTIATLASMGCERIWIGAESGSQRVLDEMSRRTDASRTREMIRLLQHYGIRAGTFIMVGYEGETWRDLDETKRHLCDALPDDMLTTLTYPIKGTPYYDEVQSRIIELKPWAEGSDRDLTLAGRGSRRFYAHAQAWLHSELAVARESRRRGHRFGPLMKSFVRAKTHRAAMYLTRREVERG